MDESTHAEKPSQPSGDHRSPSEVTRQRTVVLAIRLLCEDREALAAEIRARDSSTLERLRTPGAHLGTD